MDFLSGACWHQRSDLFGVFAELFQTADQSVHLCWGPLDLVLAVRVAVWLIALTVPVQFSLADFALFFKFFQGAVFYFSLLKVPFLDSLIDHEHPFGSLLLLVLRVVIVPLNPPNLEHTSSLLPLLVSLSVVPPRSTNNLLLLLLALSLQLQNLNSIQGVYRPRFILTYVSLVPLLLK